jgi:anti-sigma factor RsiW
MKCSDISSRLVDFLYEEMPADERREFLAHVDGCASCSAEVKAMSSTLGHARAALRGPLAQDPPARVRARVMEAAQAAAAAKAADVARVPRVPRPEGFFARLWKTPWLVPALGAAGVATVVLLVRVIKNPQVIPDHRPAVTEALTQPPAEPRGLQQPQARPETESKPLAGLATPQRTLAKKSAAEFDDNSYAESKRAASAGKPHLATRERDNPMTAGRKLARSSDELSGVAEQAPVLAPTGQVAVGKGGGAASMHSRKDEERLDAVAKAGPGAVAAGSPSTNRWAEPPPPRAPAAPVASAAAPAAAQPPPGKRAKAVAALGEMQESAADEGISRSAEREKAKAPMRAPTVEHAAQAEAPADKKAANKENLSFEERVRKAEKLFAERKWAEAAAAFRALIAQAPSNPAAKTWRERVAAAESAQEQARAAKASKAHVDDTLDGQ